MAKNPNYEDVTIGGGAKVKPHPSQVEKPKPVVVAPRKEEKKVEQPKPRRKRGKDNGVSQDG